MLDAAGKLGKILIGMNKALGEIPLTVKMRTGVKEGRNNAHKLMPRIGAEWNAAAMTVSYPISFSLVYDTKSDSLRRSCMVGRDNSDTANWQIGNIFENVSTLFEHVKPMKTVRWFPP